jgi:DNA-binding response OmpR family regulator
VPVSDAKRVLIVEDEGMLGSNLREYLCRKGWQPLLARDGRSAVEAASRFSPSVILLDFQLPDMDGFQVLANIRAGQTRCGCILMTANTDESIVFTAPAHGIGHVLHKPFPLSEMEQRLLAASSLPAGDSPSSLAA